MVDFFQRKLLGTSSTKTVLKVSILSWADAGFWRSSATDSLRSRVARQPITRRARNVILFLGDGMSIPTLVAARILSGGEASLLAFEKFPYSGLSKVSFE